jgi:hypothetical protein
MCLPVDLDFVWEEHRPELAHDGVEALVLERQCQRVRLPPYDPRMREPPGRMIEHGWVQVGGNDAHIPAQA